MSDGEAVTSNRMYDLIIIGGSAAGATAGIYAARRGLSFKVIAKDLGGEVALSGEIGNWPGIIKTDGIELSDMFKKHLKSYEPDILEGPLVKSVVKNEDGTFTVSTDDGQQFTASAVIVATGIHPRELGVPGEKEYKNNGVSYCTVCDGPIFKGQETVTIGGGNSALESALMMADIATKVTVINKNAQFKGEQVLIENLEKKGNVTVVTEAMTTEIVGDGKKVTSVKYTDKDGNAQEVPAGGVFIHIGNVPNSQVVGDEVAKNDFKNIIVNMAGETNVPGLFAAGDVTDVPHQQIVIAAGQGSAAALSAVQYINKVKQ